MTRILFALLGFVALAAVATSGPAHAIKFYTGKNGNKITCTFVDCVAYCRQTGGTAAGCRRPAAG